MAIAAQEDALTGLGSDDLKRARNPPSRKAEGLLRRIEMMEMKRRGVSVITADHALATSLLDQDSLHLATAPLNGLNATPLAPILRPMPAHELGPTV
jgi:hypothetical protein